VSLADAGLRLSAVNATARTIHLRQSLTVGTWANSLLRSVR
jgi:hypothetical protein